MSTTSFRELGLDDVIVEAIESSGYEFATPVQAAGIPVFLTGQDIILQAQTGTGKTAAFALPIIHLLDANPGVPEALILAPTRELASQIAREFERAGSASGVIACAIYGGAPFDPQIEALKKAQVICATPGRLLDHLRRGTIDLGKLRIFGLDEADEMLSMGFEKDVFDIISHLPEDRQSFLCSATLNEPILRLASNFLDDDAETINLSSDSVGAQSIEHARFDVTQQEKLAALRRILTAYCADGGLIFANTRAATFRITASLQAEGFEVDVLNGDLPQKEREKALKRMRSGEVQYLVATDVAARGIDISGLPSVVNYDMPDSPDVYVHRTGRTGRAGQFGIAFSLVTPGDVSVHHYLTKFYKLRLRPRPLPDASDVLAIRADKALDTLLDGLDADASLSYGAMLPAAQRLLEREDGPRVIAKLIAHFRSDAAPARDLPAVDDADSALHPTRDDVQSADDDAASTPAATLHAEDDRSASEAEAPTAPADEARDTAPASADTAAESGTEAAQGEPDAEQTPATSARRSRSRRSGRAADKSPARDRSTDATPAPDTDDEEHHAAEDEVVSTGNDTDQAQRIHDWILENSGSRGRAHVRSAHAVARALDLDKDLVIELGRTHPGMEVTGRSRPMLRLTSPQGADAADTTHPGRAEPSARPADEKRDRGSSEGDAARSETRRGRGGSDRGPARSETKRDRPAPARPSRRATPRKETVTIFDEPSDYVSVNISGVDGVDNLEEFAETLAHVAGLEREDLGRVRTSKGGCSIEIRELYLDDFVKAINGAPVAGRSLKSKRARK